jgi:hypothetical protein
VTPARAARLLRRGLRALPHVLRGGLVAGSCPICERRTLFVAEGPWLRDQLFCLRCRSIPRGRALIAVLEAHFPAWRTLRLHESSPAGPASRKLARECRGYVATQLLPDTPPGSSRHGVRCEDLEAQTFADGAFDLVVTQDVFEHVLDPARGFREVARTLRPGGAHVFTVPWYPGRQTRARAVREHGAVRHLAEPEYHANPIDPRGSLVVTEWGRDLGRFIEAHSGLGTEVVRLHDRRRGIDGEFREVFVSRKGP